MRRTLTGVCLGMACLLAAGCSGIKGYPDKFNDYNNALLTQMDQKLFPPKDAAKENSTQPKLSVRYDVCLRISEEGNGQACRNSIMSDLIIFIDLQYNQFRADLYRDNVTGRLFGDSIPIILSSAGIFATTEVAKNTMLAITSGVSGVKTSYEKSVLFEMTMPAIIEQMDNDRKKLSADLYKNMGESTDKYPLPRAIGDINAYFLAGTLPGAIKSLVKSTAEANSVDKKLLLAQKMVSLQSSIARQTRAVKANILKGVTNAMTLQKEQVAFLEKNFNYKSGGDATDTTDVSGALTYVLTLVSDDDTYNSVNGAVTGAMKTS